MFKRIVNWFCGGKKFSATGAKTHSQQQEVLDQSSAAKRFCPSAGAYGTKNEVILSGVLCPECGHPVTCIYWENGGGNSFNDNFVHQCTNPECNYVADGPYEKWGGSASYEYPWPNCPFCGRASV